ncbi:MAG: DUF2927 domain-containing protein [Candidatus Dadabacteria bacterium]|nr:DUF2927 domain-containing protein [Candidatus Dadabacteria bacterium]
MRTQQSRSIFFILLISALLMLQACAAHAPRGWVGTGVGRYSGAEIGYFFEVACGSEFGSSTPRIRKWMGRVRVAAEGSPTPEDLSVLEAVAGEVNRITGLELVVFDPVSPNVVVYFVPESRFKYYEPNYVPKNYGFMWAWWRGSGEIYKARVMISTTGITQSARSHLIREELTQALGLMNDSWRYMDSVFYQGWMEVTEYSQHDRAVIEILYNKLITPGMTRERVIEILRQTGGSS